VNETKHLKRLSQVKSNACIKFLTPAVSGGNHCPMRMASVIAEDIKGISSLLVGVEECTIHSRFFTPKPEGKQGELHWLYALDSNEVVFGCRDGLIDALKKMDKAGAKAILMILTCIPELIGEDIEGIIHEVQSELSATVTFVMLGQFKNVSYPPGAWKTMESFVRLMRPKEIDKSCINILGCVLEEEHIPIPSILPELEKRGFSFKYIDPKASLEEFQSANGAVLNLVLSPFTQPLAEKMNKEFGIPYVSLHKVYEVEAINSTYKNVAKHLSFSWGNEFEEEKNKVVKLEKKAKERLKGLKYVLCTRIDIVIPLAIYLKKLGMESVLLHLEEYYPEDKNNAKELLALGDNPLICRMVNEEADLPIIEKLNLDLCFGFLSDKNKTIPCVSEMLDFYGQVGYERTSALLKRILTVLDESEKGGR